MRSMRFKSGNEKRDKMFQMEKENTQRFCKHVRVYMTFVSVQSRRLEKYAEERDEPR